MMPSDLQRYLGTGQMPPLGQPLAVLRGVDLMPQDEAMELTRGLYADDPLSFTLGTLHLPPKARLHHLMFMGSSGGGKSSVINQLLRDSLEDVGHGHRLFIWDQKGEMRQYLEPYRNDLKIDYLNPVFEHGVGVAVARDVDTPMAADQFADDMISPRAEAGKAANMEWVEAARGVFAEVVKIFQRRAPGDWRLIDVIEACSTEEALERVLSLSRVGESLLGGILGTDRQTSGVLFNLQGAVRSMRTLAAAMVHSTNISLREWAYGPGSVLVLQHHHDYAKALAGFERWVFGRAVSLAISGSKSANRTTLFYLDEVRHGPFETHLMELVTVGRGKGIGIVMGLTDISGLNDQLNDPRAEEVLGSFSTQVLFMNNNPKTAGWVSERVGSPVALMPEVSASVSRAPEGAEKKYKDDLYAYLYPKFYPRATERATTCGRPPKDGPGAYRQYASDEEIDLYERHGIIPARFNAERPTPKSETLNVSFKEVERPLATRTEVMNLPQADVVDGQGLTVVAYVVSTFVGKPTLMMASGMNHPDVTLIPVTEDELPNVERPAAQLDFAGWGEEDEERLNLPEPPAPPERTKRPSGRRRMRPLSRRRER